MLAAPGSMLAYRPILFVSIITSAMGCKKDSSDATPDAAPLVDGPRDDAIAIDASVADHGFADFDGRHAVFTHFFQVDLGVPATTAGGSSAPDCTAPTSSNCTRLTVTFPDDAALGVHSCAEGSNTVVGLDRGIAGEGELMTSLPGGSCTFTLVERASESGQRTHVVDLTAKVIEYGPANRNTMITAAELLVTY